MDFGTGGAGQRVRNRIPGPALWGGLGGTIVRDRRHGPREWREIDRISSEKLTTTPGSDRIEHPTREARRAARGRRGGGPVRWQGPVCRPLCCCWYPMTVPCHAADRGGAGRDHQATPRWPSGYSSVRGGAGICPRTVDRRGTIVLCAAAGGPISGGRRSRRRGRWAGDRAEHRVGRVGGRACIARGRGLPGRGGACGATRWAGWGLSAAGARSSARWRRGAPPGAPPARPADRM